METTTQAVPTGGDTQQSWRQRTAQQAKTAARAKATALAADTRVAAKSTLYRNRRQLVPFKAAATVAGTGAAAELVSLHPQVADVVAGAGAAGITAAGGAYALRKATGRIPAELTSRVRTGLVAGCAWCAALPFTGVDAGGMWLGLGAATVGLSARWWQRIRPGYPTGPAAAESESAPAQQAEPDSAPVSTALIIERWATAIARNGGPLPGAEIGMPRKLEHGRAFPVQLDPGAQTVAGARSVLDRIASGLRIPAAKLAIEPANEEDPSVVELRIVDNSPVLSGVAYSGPRVVTDDHGTHLALGPYADGEGDALFTVFAENSMRSGYVFGGTGSGKSRLVELIAIGLRQLGVEVWYLDPQEGQSSPALMQEADWALSGLGDDDDPHRNVRTLLRAVKQGMGYRSKKLAATAQPGFKHSDSMPGVMVIIEESSDVFGAVDDDGKTFGAKFGEVSKKVRKNGMGILGVGHIYTLPTFGNDKMLRSSLTKYNLFALKTTEKSDASLLPSGMPDPTALPNLAGFGYGTSEANPRVAQFRAEYVADPHPWLSQMSGHGLDPGTANAIGDDYVRRHEIAKERHQALLRELEAYESGEIEVGDDEDDDMTKARPAQRGGSVLSLPSIGGGTVRTDDGAAVPVRSLTEREQDLMDALADGGEWSTDALAKELGLTPQRVRQLVKRIGPTRLVKVRNGVYRARLLDD